MIEPALQQILTHQHRQKGVIIVTLLTGLVVLWPAVDGYIEARKNKNEARAKLDTTNEEIAKLPLHTKLFERKTAELEALTRRTIKADSAQTLRNNIVQLVRDAGCTMRRVRLGNATRRDWMENDDPVTGADPTDPGNETPFQLVSRQLSISITGKMTKIHGFLAEMYKIDKTIHTRSITLQRAGRTKGTAMLDLDLLLFDLEEKTET